MIPIILSGGSGTRLWPYSRSKYPKQFLPLCSENTMLQETWLRVKPFPFIDSPLIVCNEDHRFIVAEQLRGIQCNPNGIILEPFGRNTAPAIACAALQLINQDIDQPMLVLPADHLIKNETEFLSSLEAASAFAELGKLVTFGIVPTAPETGFGYIRTGENIQQDNSNGFFVDRFVEKPSAEVAESYIQSGEYLWNSGMFCFKPSRYLEELGNHNLDMLEACKEALNKSSTDLDFVRLDKTAFESCPEDSIDYAVMEKTSEAVVVPLDAGWNDVGSWSSLWDVSEKDEQGNTVKGDVISIDSQNCYIQTDKKLIATVGMENTIVVETDDAILVANKDQVQNVKTVVSQLKLNERSEALLHRKVYRPWGFYDSIENGERFQVKRIVVNPGQRLSLQMHHHRAEHWIVVKGTATVTKGEESFLLSENQSTFIPLGVKHRLENPGSIPLELIEVQSGSYLGEDDIVRFDDIYGRSQ